MPFRPTDLDTGFSTYLAKPMPEPKSARGRSLEGLGALATGNMATFNEITQESFDTISAGSRMELAPLATIDLMTRPAYKRDVNFDTEARLKEDGLWNDYSENFIGVQSEQEYLAVSGRIAQENKDRKHLASAGVGGIAVQIAAGLIDPTIFLPFVGGLKGIRAIAAGAALGGAGAALQEGPLQLAQETRTAEESMSAIAMGTVIGGVLGGAVAFARRTPKELGDDLVRLQNNDMARDPRSGTIPNAAPAVPSGMFRFWHGGSGQFEVDGHVWLANNRGYGEGYAGSSGRLFYVDLTKEEAIVNGVWDEINNFPINGKTTLMSRMIEVPHGAAARSGGGNFASLGAAAAEGPVPTLVRMSPLPKWIDPIYDATILPITSAISNLTLPNLGALGPIAGKSLGELTPGNITEIFPTVFNFNSQSTQASRMTAKLSDSGMALENGRAGGTVENRVRTYDAPVAKALDAVEKAFAQYRFGAQKAGKLGAVTKSKIVGLLKTEEFMSAQQFRQQIGRAMRQGDKHDIPEVAAMAKYLRTEIYDPLFKLAKKVGVFKDIPEDVLGDSSYLNRVYNLELISARKPEFIKKLQEHFNNKLSTEFREQAAKLMDRQAKLAERTEDFSRPYDEVVKLREKFKEDLEKLDGGRDAKLADLETSISDKRSTARTFDRGTSERKAALDEARSLESQGGEALTEVRANRATIKRRLKNLTQAYSAVTDRQQGKLDKIARAEDASFSSLQVLIRRSGKIIEDFDKLDDALLNAKLDELRGNFMETAAKYDKNEERIAKIFDDEFVDDLPTSPFAQAARVETAAVNKMTDLAERIDDLSNLDREDARRALRGALDVAIEKAQGIVERRAVRSARLAEQAADLDPDKALKKIGDLKDASRQAQRDFEENWRVRGADSLDPVTGVADFAEYSRDMATNATDRILGTNMRLPGLDIVLNPKDAELARTLDIDSNILTSQDGRSFLEDDVKELVMRYNRTLAPDIELHRAFGDFAPDMKKNAEFDRLGKEYDAILERTQTDMAAGVNPKTGKKVGKPYSQEQIDKASQEIGKERLQVSRNFEAMIARLRHQRGVPNDPAAFGARAAKVASNANVLRFMGGVVISSLADVGRPIMKHGLLRTFKDGYIPFIKAMGDINFTAEGFTTRQLRATGAALDVVLHSRSGQMFDVGDYIVRGGMLNKTLEYGSGKIGIVAGFDYWTSAMKQITGAVSNARLMDSLAVVAGGEPASAKELKAAMDYLAQGGIDGTVAENIWRQTSVPGGAEKVNGQWWANTEAWDAETRTAYNAFIYRDVSNTIVTPGIDGPLFVDSSPLARLLFQFKSFGMSSTTRTMMAGLQQRDMAFATGATVSLAMGALSYYTYANIIGGPILAAMQKDLKEGNWEKFADEAINRSGLLGFGSDIQSIGAAIPGIQDKVTFSGNRTTRQGGANLLETLAGPTFGDAANTIANVVTGAWSPTQATAHQVRTLLPLQNHSLLRRLFDQIENAAKSKLPESRR